MGELMMDCFGSVILFGKGGDSYCSSCPLSDRCEAQVAENRVHLEEALKHPVYDADGKFWESGRKVSLQRRAAAARQSSVPPVKTIKPATPPPTIAATAPTRPGLVSPAEAMTREDLPKKVREQVEKWVQKSVQPAEILSGKNPFLNKTGFKFATLVAEAYLASPRKMTKKALGEQVAALMIASDGTAWSPASLGSNVNIVTGAFAACGVEIVEK